MWREDQQLRGSRRPARHTHQGEHTSRDIFRTVTSSPHVLAMGQGPHVLQLILDQLLLGEWSLSGAHTAMGRIWKSLSPRYSQTSCMVNPGREGFQLSKFGSESRYLNPCLPPRCHPSRVAQMWVFRSLPGSYKRPFLQGAGWSEGAP